MITAGVDLGTQSVKAVILRDGEVISRSQAFSGFDPTKAAEHTLEEALKNALPERNHRLIPANIRAIEAGAALARKQ